MLRGEDLLCRTEAIERRYESEMALGAGPLFLATRARAIGPISTGLRGAAPIAFETAAGPKAGLASRGRAKSHRPVAQVILTSPSASTWQ